MLFLFGRKDFLFKKKKNDKASALRSLQNGGSKMATNNIILMFDDEMPSSFVSRVKFWIFSLLRKKKKLINSFVIENDKNEQSLE